MSYAIVRNEKLTRDEAKGRYVHNERKTRGHTNKDIDPEKTYLRSRTPAKTAAVCQKSYPGVGKRAV